MNRALVVLTDGTNTFIYSRPNQRIYFIKFSRVDGVPMREWIAVGDKLYSVDEALNYLEKAGLPCKLHVD